VEFFAGRFLDLAGLRVEPGIRDLAAGADALALIELSGDPESVAGGIDLLEALARDLGGPIAVARSEAARARFWGIRHAASPVIAARAAEGLVSMQFIEDSVVPPARLGDYLGSLDQILRSEETDAVVFGHAGDANVHVNPLVDVRRAGWRERVRRILEQTVDEVARLGGTLTGEHGDGRIRAPFQERIWGAELVGAFRRVKDAFDPAGIFNPGVVLPVPGQDPLEGLTSSRRSS
jgi:FAD/FMN-containing dehydrogenase